VNNNKLREIRHVYDTNLSDFKRKLVLVPLTDDDTPQYATLFEEKFWELVDHGCSDLWWINKDNQVSLWSVGLKMPVLVKRLIVKADAGESVSTLDGDSLNLRTNNLCIGNSTRAKRRDWDYIKPNTNDAKPRCKHIWEYSNENNWLKGVNQIHEQRQQQQLEQQRLAQMIPLFSGLSA